MPASGPTAPLGSHRPLTGLRVVELASVLAGPLVGTFLAELGADVTKVEHPERGDVTRNWRSLGESPDGPSAYFAAANGPKQSVRIDLKSRKASSSSTDSSAAPTSCSKTPCPLPLRVWVWIPKLGRAIPS